jgi:protein TonB
MKAISLFTSWENPQDVSRANLLFKNRNKSYGGYFIRVYYPERIFRAFLLALFGFGIFVTGIVLAGKYLIPSTVFIPPNTGPERVYYLPASPITPPGIKQESFPKKPDNAAQGTTPVAVDTTSDTDTTTSSLQTGNTTTNNSTGNGTDSTSSGHSGGNNTNSKNKEPIRFAEVAPMFPGGEAKLFEYLQKNIVYPVHARENNTQGYVYVTFVVDKQGKIRDVKLLRGIGDGCEEEAIRVVKKMPDWSPGLMQGEPVAVQYNLPVNFKLR